MKNYINFKDKEPSRFKVNNWLYDYFNSVKEMPGKLTELHNIITGVKTDGILFDEDALISFGRFLLSEERLKKIKDYEDNDERAEEIFRQVTDAAFCNWKSMRFSEPVSID